MAVGNPFFAFAVVLVLLLPLPSRAAPPPSPVFLPGFPMTAGDNVLLVWSPVPNAVSYKVFLYGKVLGTTGASSYATPLPDSGDEAQFRVSAISDTGEESSPGPPGVLRLRGIESPTGLKSAVNPDQPSTMLVWNAVRGAIGYNVYRMEDMGVSARLHSGTDTHFRDRSVRKGSRYEYAVAAIDRSGREGNRSPWLEVGIREEPPLAQTAPGISGAPDPGTQRGGKEKERRAPSPLDASFHEVMSIDKIRQAALRELSYLGPGIDNVFWAVLPRAREVHAINRSGEIVATLGPTLFDNATKGFIPHKMAVGPDGRLVISDATNGSVACFDRNGNSLWTRRVVPPPGNAKQVWQGFPERFRNFSASPSSILILPGEILVSDQRFQLIYRLNHEGEPLGYITHYKKGTDVWRLRRIGELEAVPGKGILVTFPLARKALLVNEEFVVISEILGSRKDSKHGFLGLHGARFAPGEGVLFTDPTTGRIQVYDPETGDHLRELRTPFLPNPNMAVWDGNERLWVYLAMENRIAVLTRKGPGR